MQTRQNHQRNQFRVVLAFQGGGALGAYQAGVYQALHEHNLVPEWVVGTSIGAINAAIIAGNEPDKRLAQLQSFWDGIALDDVFHGAQTSDWMQQFNVWHAMLRTLTFGVPGFFLTRPLNPFALGLAVQPEVAGFYDTSALRETLNRLVDFNYINRKDSMRLTASAVRVTSGELANFDSAHSTLNLEHIMASCAIPPGFPAVRIDNQLYWDGGLYSNTPLETVLDDEPRINTLCFMVDLWCPTGEEPKTFGEVQTREKDVRFFSRSQRHIEAYREKHNLRRAVNALYNSLKELGAPSPTLQKLGALGCGTTMHVVRLMYPGHDWSMSTKDINFSRGSIQWRWQQGLQDASLALKQARWLNPVPANTGIIVHDLGHDENLVNIHDKKSQHDEKLNKKDSTGSRSKHNIPN